MLTNEEPLVSGRQLNHFSVDPDDPEVIKPFHFLLGCPNENVSTNVIDPNAIATSSSSNSDLVLKLTNQRHSIRKSAVIG